MADILEVTFNSGRAVSVLVTPRGEVAFERQFDLPFYEVNARRERMYWLAWQLLTYKGEETRDFDTFISDVTSIEAVVAEVDEAPDPTRSSPLPADSLDSLSMPVS